jgi:DNA helicase II / ATP-dependent DNA helicase PcrA
MQSPNNNLAVIAAAGSCKTQYIIDKALAAPESRRTLVTTYTRENCEQIVRRLQEAKGCIPPNVSVLGWFTFLMNQAARPYQSRLTGRIDYARSLNFEGKHPIGISHKMPLRYYFDRHADFYRDGVAEFAVRVNQATGGRVMRRLEALYDEIYIDELQDLAGYDLPFLDLLFASKIQVTVVGDPRQYIYATTRHNKNRKYRGYAIVDWLKHRPTICPIEPRTESWRCNQEICDWADALFPDLPRTISRNLERTGHDGIFRVAHEDVPLYFETYCPSVLRWDKRTNTLGLAASNMKASKGCTFERVLIFPTQPMLKYLKSGNLAVLNSLEALYVAVTRARYSVAFVVDRKDATYGVPTLFDDIPYILHKAS